MRTCGLSSGLKPLIVVSDTSPILNLTLIGRLELLPLLYGRVLIPRAVFDELTNSRCDLPAAIMLASLPWLCRSTYSAYDGEGARRVGGLAAALARQY